MNTIENQFHDLYQYTRPEIRIKDLVLNFSRLVVKRCKHRSEHGVNLRIRVYHTSNNKPYGYREIFLCEQCLQDQTAVKEPKVKT